MEERKIRIYDRGYALDTEKARINLATPLPTAFDLMFTMPVEQEIVINARQTIQDIIDGKDHRKLVEAGSCSVHNFGGTLSYTDKIATLQKDDRVKDKVFIVERIHLEKPRTGPDWPGFLIDPYLDETNNLIDGIKLGRKLYVAVNKLGVPCSTEMLNPNNIFYFSDCLASVKIGARSVRNQDHRYAASSLAMPVGFKNDPFGDISAGIKGIEVARVGNPHVGQDYDGRMSKFETTGNPYSYLILRGGSSGPNFDQTTVENTRKTLLDKFGLVNGILVDCSHDNTKDKDGKKDYRNQIPVALEIARQINGGQQGLLGISIESYIKPGSQKWDPNVTPDPEISITDGCLGWDETEELILEFANSIKI